MRNSLYCDLCFFFSKDPFFLYSYDPPHKFKMTFIQPLLFGTEEYVRSKLIYFITSHSHNLFIHNNKFVCAYTVGPSDVYLINIYLRYVVYNITKTSEEHKCYTYFKIKHDLFQ